MVRRIIYTMLFTLTIIGVQAQSESPVTQGMDFIKKQAASWQLIDTDYAGALVSDMYQDPTTGHTYIYYQQAINGVPVANAITPVVITQEGRIHNVGHGFVANAQAKLANNTVKLDPAQAVESAAKALGIQAGTVSASSKSVTDGKTTFSGLDFVHNDVHVQQQYVLAEDKLVLTWDLSLDVKGSADYWNAKIDANTGELVAKHNYTVYCNHAHGKYAKHKNCGATKTVVKENNTMTVAAAEAAMLGGQYNVFPLPVESPIHGERAIISDDMFPGASPFGWHDTNGQEGAEFTITRGNNVHVYLDREDTNFSSNDEVDGGPDLLFDFPYDLNNEAEVNLQTSQANLFTTINQIHDIMYRLGFTEPTGNFQQNNYGNSGFAGDFVVAQAFDGIDLYEAGLDDTKINNANFSTPGDGISGRMQMFLWENTGGALSIDEPTNISGFIQQIGTAVAAFGGTIPDGNDDPITGKVVIARDSDPANPTAACEDIVNADEIAGNIALIDRGLCNFSLKAFKAQEAGAITCLICNVPGADGPGSSGETVIGMAGGLNADDVTITPIFVQKSVCDRIRNEIANGVDVIMTLKQRDAIGPVYRDAAFDNGVVAHEYGHGISNRLVGGPSQAGCLSSGEQMGEGISDFVTLLLTVEEGDTRTDPRGIGNYVDFLDQAGGGIRTYPYTTDMVLNPRTYEELPGFLDAEGNPLIYSVGEVWTAALWELYWNLVDENGLDITWSDETSGNFMMGRLFVEGMRLAGCNPTLIRMRDAIIEADEMLYDGVHDLAIWSAFAKRGMGFGATGGTSNDITDGTASFELFPLAIQTLKIDKTSETLVDQGATVEVSLIVRNHIRETRTGIVITDQIPPNAIYVEGSASAPVTVNGSELTFEVGTLDYTDEVSITYSIQLEEGTRSNTLYINDIEDADFGDDLEINRIEGFNSIWRISSAEANSGERAFYSPASDDEDNDQVIQMNNLEVSGERPIMRFWHKYDTEPIIDGGFVRVSTDGILFDLVGDDFIRNGYDANLDYSTFALPNLRGFSGSTDGEWTDSYLDLSKYKGETISVQFRFGTNATITSDAENPGWFVDDVEIFDLAQLSSVACVVSDAGDDEQCSTPLEIIVNSSGVVSSTNEPRFKDLTIGIAPNPSADYVSVSITVENNDTPLQLDLMSIDGRLISSQSLQSTKGGVRSFDVSQLHSGVYLIAVKQGANIITTKKVIVQH